GHRGPDPPRRRWQPGRDPGHHRLHHPGTDPDPGRDPQLDRAGSRLGLHHHRPAVRAGADPDIYFADLHHAALPRMAGLRPHRDGPRLDRDRLRHHLENHEHPGVANEYFHYRLRLPGLRRHHHRD